MSLPVSEPGLLGRQAELEILDRTLRLGSHSGVVLLIVGEPGIGKSALLDQARRMARSSGQRVLDIVGVQAEAQLPFAGLHQLLTRDLDRTDQLARAHREALLGAFGLHNGPPPDLYLIAEATVGLLAAAAADGPIAILADDVQWLDPQTHQILTFVAHRAEAARLAVIGVARTGHPGPFVDAGFPRLELLGVDDETADTILAGQERGLSTAELVGIRQAASGNPLALLELPATWRDSPASDLQAPNLSARLERSFADRLVELPAPTRDALLIAAVDWVDELSEVLHAATVLTGTLAVPAVFAPAESVGLLTVGHGHLRFRHPLVRSAILQSESMARRHAANGALAGILLDDQYRRTWHRAQSIVGPDDEIANELERTAAELLQRGAVLSAVATLERSAQLTAGSARRGRRLLVAAEHAFGLGRAEAVERLLEAAARTDLIELDWARMQWLREIFNDGVPGDAQRVMELCDIARRSAAADDVDLALNLLLGAALRCWWADTGPRARAEVAATVDTLTAHRGDARHLAAIAVAEPVLRAADVAQRLAAITLDEPEDGDALRLYGMAAHAIGDSALATDILGRAGTRLRDRGSLGLLPHVLGMQAHIRLDLGDWDGADEAAKETNRLSVETGQPIWTMNNNVVIARSRALRGEPLAALDLIDEAEIPARRRRLNDTLSLVQMARGTALVALGQYDQAYDALRRLFDPTDPSYHEREAFSSVSMLAEAAVESDQLDDAHRVLEHLEAVAAVTPAPILHVHLLHARAVLADDAHAPELYRIALAADLSRWPWLRARIELSYGRWLARTGRTADAQRHLSSALDVFQRIGAPAWSRLAEAALLDQRGGSPSSAGQSRPTSDRHGA